VKRNLLVMCRLLMILITRFPIIISQMKMLVNNNISSPIIILIIMMIIYLYIYKVGKIKRKKKNVADLTEITIIFN